MPERRKNLRKIFLFMNVSLDGYFETPDHDLSWAHTGEFEAFSPDREGEVDTILFGHRTYDMFKKFWPTPQAKEFQPKIAKFLEENQKVVVSHQPFDPGWKNVTVLSTDAIEGVKRLKEQPGNSIIMFGSNNLCVSLMPHGLIDEFQLMLNPVALGDGTSLFKGLPEKIPLNLTQTRQFKSGNILLTYKPV
jgi:dihydrofolate reductase